MSLAQVELVIHPIRLRILQTLSPGPLTTQEIARRLPDVPKSSIYRHLRLLLEGSVVALAETRLVNGIEEKVYRLQSATDLSGDDFAAGTNEDHFRYFTTYLISLLHGFAAYLEATPQADLTADYVGFREVIFYASPVELDQFQTVLRQQLQPLLQNEPATGRRKHKLSTIAFPVKS